jgi:hypothetical protein
MDSHRITRIPTQVVEPPRDGEFFFEDARVEKELAGILERAVRPVIRIVDYIGSIVGRHPVMWVSLGVGFGVVTTSLVMKL